MKKLAQAVALAVGVMAGASAMAAPTFNIGGYTGPLEIKFGNFEEFTNVGPGGAVQVGSENFGLISITSITDRARNVIWSQGQDGSFLSGVFNGITVTSVTDVNGRTNIQSVGGRLDIWLTDTPLDPTQGLSGYAAAGGGCAVGGLCYNGITNTGDGELFLSLEFVSGIVPGTDTTVNGNFDANTLPTSGEASSYLNVIGGTFGSNFDTNSQGGALGRDFLFQNTFFPNVTTDPAGGPVGVSCSGLTGLEARGCVGDWILLSDDPARGNFQESDVPAPATTALLGLGMLGLAASLRRRPR